MEQGESYYLKATKVCVGNYAAPTAEYDSFSSQEFWALLLIQCSKRHLNKGYILTFQSLSRVNIWDHHKPQSIIERIIPNNYQPEKNSF